MIADMNSVGRMFLIVTLSPQNDTAPKTRAMLRVQDIRFITENQHGGCSVSMVGVGTEEDMLVVCESFDEVIRRLAGAGRFS